MSKKQATKVYIISCIKFQRRRDFLTKHLGELGVEFEFLDSGDKDKFTEAQLQNWNPPRNLKAGEIACTLGHRMAYEKIISEGLSHALILEDDVILSPKILPLLQDTTLQIKDFCFVKSCIYGGNETGPCELVAMNLNSKRMLSNNIYCTELSHPPHGTCAYFISKEGAVKRLKDTEVLVETIDHYRHSKENYTIEAITSPILCWLSLHSHSSGLREVEGKNKFNKFEWLKRHDFYFKIRRFLTGLNRENRKIIQQKIANGQLSNDGNWDILPWGNNDVLHHSDPLSRP